MSECLSDRVRRAAHGRHLCHLCGHRITAGERYRDSRWADGGTAYTLREHLRCGEFLRRVGADDEMWNLSDFGDLCGENRELARDLGIDGRSAT